MDEKQGLDTPLIAGPGFSDGIKRQIVPKSAGLCGYLFQVLFQVYSTRPYKQIVAIFVHQTGEKLGRF